MISRRTLKTAAFVPAAVALAIQFIPVDRTNPPAVSPAVVPQDVEAILEGACFDCHSHRTVWPWYGRVAPVSWWMAHHVEEARGDLNFDAWPQFDPELQELALRDIEQQLLKGEMPPGYYKIAHAGARLTADQTARLLEWSRDR